MKPTLLPLLLSPLLVVAAGAEDLPLPEGSLDAAHGVIEQKNGNWHFWGDVHLVYPGVLDLTCDDMQVAQAPDANGKPRPDRIIATTNVVMGIVLPPTTNSVTQVVKPGGIAHATAFQAVFNGTENTVVLTGSTETGQPKVENPEGTLRADVLTFDRAKGRFTGNGGFHMTFTAQMLKGLTSKTNAPSAK